VLSCSWPSSPEFLQISCSSPMTAYRGAQFGASRQTAGNCRMGRNAGSARVRFWPIAVIGTGVAAWRSLPPNARGERRATHHRHPHRGKKPVVWPVRSTAWFGWERPVRRGGVLLRPRPCSLVDHPTSCPCSRLYWITSSAWKRICGGMVRPRAFAVFKLMTSSNFMGCSTGRSAGFAPFKILSA
jgi:hypothetical protein